MPELFCFGFGYSAQELATRLQQKDWTVVGSVRSLEGVQALKSKGFDPVLFGGKTPDRKISQYLARCTHLLLSAPPDDAGDPLLVHHADDLAAAEKLSWIGYLSTVGVYGNHDGAWITEHASLNTNRKRGRRRVAAEQAWLDFGQDTGKAVQVFRLAGIYGPGRSAVDRMKAGQARRIIKPGQVFNRIHVADIATVLEASIASPNPGAIYNVCDDEPAPPQDLITYAAEILNMEPPPEIPFEEADLTPMARSFYGDNKRISNARIKEELGVTLAFPNYREGLRSVYQGLAD